MTYPGMPTSRLLLDRARCRGQACGVKADCLRHVALSNVGPQTPIHDTACSDTEEREAFILAAQHVTQNQNGDLS